MKRIAPILATSLLTSHALAVEVIIDGNFDSLTAISTSPAFSVGASPGPPNTGDYTSNSASLGDDVPGTYGVWSGDPTQVVTVSGLGNSWAAAPPAPFNVNNQRTITPRSGSNMLQFVGTSNSDVDYDTVDNDTAVLSNTGSDLWQAIDLSAYAADVSAGTVTIETEGWFASAGLNTEFLVETRYYSRVLTDPFSAPGGYTSDFTITEIYGSGSSVPSLGDPWRNITTGSNSVPTNTEFVLIRIGALENVATAGDHGEEFTANYADDISVNLLINGAEPNPDPDPDPNPDPDPDPPVIPEPTRAALLLVGALGMIARRRRK